MTEEHKRLAMVFFFALIVGAIAAVFIRMLGEGLAN
jgi:hypothetical protein